MKKIWNERKIHSGPKIGSPKMMKEKIKPSLKDNKDTNRKCVPALDWTCCVVVNSI